MTPAPGVAEVVRRVRRHVGRRAVLAGVLWAVVIVSALLLLAWLFAGREGWRQGTLVPLALDVVFVALLAAGAWSFRRARGRWLSERRLAGSMEEAAGLRAGTLLGSLELGRSLPPGVSGSLAAMADRSLVERLGRPPGELAGRSGGEIEGWGRRARAGLAILLPLVVAAAVLAPGRSLTAWHGLGTPFGLAASPVLTPLRVAPGDVEILRGSDLRIVVEAADRDSVRLHWQASGDVARTATADASSGSSGFTMRDVRAPVRYWASAPDGARSPVYRVTPVDPLFVTDVTLEVVFPPHTGRPPEEYRGEPPPLAIPVGTRLQVSGWASRELREAALEAEDGEGLRLEVDGRSFEGRWVPRTSGLFRWRFRDADGAAAEMAPPPLDLTLLPDSAPRVRFVLPGRDTVLPLDLRQPLVIQAGDDYGLDLLELVAVRVTSLGERKEPVRQRLELGGTLAAQARPLLDLSAWGLLPGDTVRYHARAVDNSPQGQESATREFVLRMPGASEMRRGAQDRLEDVARRMEELAEAAAEAARESREMERQAAVGREGSRERNAPFRQGTERGADPLDFQQREDVQRAMERQAEMERQVDSAAQELERLAEAMREAGMSDGGLREDLAELQELLEQLASQEMRQRLDESAEALESADARQAQEALRQLTEDQEAFRERLEESLERFRKAAVEQDFRATTAEAEELARQERALADAMREDADPRQRAEQQEGLEARAGEMEDRMERLEERLQRLGEEDAAAEVQEARERSSQARQAMREAAQEASRQQGRQAGDRADQAAEGMEQAGEQLQQAQQEMAREQGEAVRQALQQAADDALALARRQAEIRERMRGADGEGMEELRGDVAAVQQGVRNMADEVSRATRASGADRELATRMGQAMEALERTVSAMENRSAASPSPANAAERAIDGLNQVALRAMEGARQAGQQGQEQQQGGSQQVQQQMESLAQQQGSLNNQASQVMPMQLGQQALQQQLQQLAQGQQSVASGLGELSRQPGSEEQTLGDLQSLADEAEALARELAGGRLDPETRERQERLFHRLLDAGRSLENDEESEERESETAGAVERADVAPLSAEALNALRYRLPPAAVLQRLSPAERQLVIQYFERLNRDGGGDGGGR